MGGREGERPQSLFLLTLYRRALGRERPGLLPLWFAPAVLEKYRHQAGIQLVRTESAGRIKVDGHFSLDFGILPGGDLLHASAEALIRLPEAEREHWITHLVVLPLNETFVQMQLAPGSCFDDGDLRPYFSE